jgi:hypothetical protein
MELPDERPVKEEVGKTRFGGSGRGRLHCCRLTLALSRYREIEIEKKHTENDNVSNPHIPHLPGEAWFSLVDQFWRDAV